MLGALGTTGRMTDALHGNEIWIARPLRDLLAETRATGAVAVPDIADGANAILGALLLAVLGRSSTDADPTDPQFRQHLTDQVLAGILAR